MGLIGGMARTAVVAGTATAVSNRVSCRQANRWNQQADAQAYQQQQYAPPPQQQYAPPPQPAYAPPPQQAYAPPPPPPAAPAGEELAVQLRRLGDLKDQGVLTEAEFSAAKAKLLGL